MAELKPKKFGYVVHPPPPPPPYVFPTPPPPPPGMSMTDWIAYINSYIDVRARQLYDKLKKLYESQVESSDNTVHDYILLRDKGTGDIRRVFIHNDVICTDDWNGTGQSISTVNGESIVWSDLTIGTRSAQPVVENVK